MTAYGKSKELEGNIDAFKSGRAQYIVANPKTLKYGVTFTNCKYVVYYSFSYSAEDYDQSHDRNYRLGQTEQCTYIYLQSADTIDEVMYEKVKNKLSSSEFFEKLIKDASKHGINYDDLKPKDDDEIKTAMSDDEGTLKLILNDLSQKQSKKLIEEYLEKYVAEDKGNIDIYVPIKEDIQRAWKACFSIEKKLDRSAFEKYDDIDIEDLLLSSETYIFLKTNGVNTVAELFSFDSINVRNENISMGVIDEINLKRAEISILLIRRYIKISRSYSLSSESEDFELIASLGLDEEVMGSLISHQINRIIDLRVRTGAKIAELCNFSSYHMGTIRVALRNKGVVLFGEKRNRNFVSISQEQAQKISLDEMGLSMSSYNWLKRAGINTLAELINRTRDDFMRIRNWGRKNIEEILQKMQEYGVSPAEKENFLEVEMEEIDFLEIEEDDLELDEEIEFLEEDE